MIGRFLSDKENGKRIYATLIVKYVLYYTRILINTYMGGQDMPVGVVVALGVFAVMVLIAVIAAVVAAVSSVTGIKLTKNKKHKNW